MEKNIVYFGDCLEKLKLIPDKSVHLILTDLPFATTKAKWDCLIPLDPLWIQYKRIIKDDGCILLFAQIPFNILLGTSNMDMLRYEWIWEKTNATGHLNSGKMPLKAHESIMCFYKKLPTYNPQKTTGHIRKVSSAAHKRNSKKTELYNDHKLTSYDSTERFPRDVLKFKADKQKSKLHSTQKPIALLEYFINTYTNPGDLVLDSCSGSGSTGLAAKNLSRDFIMIEKDEKYYKISCERVGI